MPGEIDERNIGSQSLSQYLNTIPEYKLET